MNAVRGSVRQAPSLDGCVELDSAIVQLLTCPCCGGRLELSGATLLCRDEKCANTFPVVRGIPILINEETSLFSIDSLVREGRSVAPRPRTWKAAVRRFLPSISKNIKGRENYSLFRDLLVSREAPVRVLVLGGAIAGAGMEELLSDDRIEFVESDVAFGPRTGLICDAHDIPFEAQSFDGVIIQAVLYLLLDPFRCVEEIYRVLKSDGWVYAETPFMVPAIGGKFDFTRFTHLGHRRLFRRFAEVSSGPVCGPGVALAWAYRHFLLSFAASRAMRSALGAVADVTSFWLKYLDYYLIERPGAVDSAAGFFFLGKKAAEPLPDRELVELYRGCCGHGAPAAVPAAARRTRRAHDWGTADKEQREQP